MVGSVVDPAAFAALDALDNEEARVSVRLASVVFGLIAEGVVSPVVGGALAQPDSRPSVAHSARAASALRKEIRDVIRVLCLIAVLARLGGGGLKTIGRLLKNTLCGAASFWRLATN